MDDSRQQLLEGFDQKKVINIDQIQRAIQQSAAIINPIKSQVEKDIVIFQGQTGAGKSTTILVLSGEKMVAFHHETTKQPILMSKNREGKNKVKIQKEIQSGTAEPSFLELSSSAIKDNHIVLWDMPGSDDNKGITQILINSYFYTRVFELQHKIKMVLVINYGDITFDEKGNSLQKKFNNFLRMFGSSQNYYQSMLMIISKCPSIFKETDAVSSFGKVKQLPFVKSNPMIKKFVQYLSGSKIKIIIIGKPNIPENNFINEQSSQDVTKQYQNTIKQFSQAVKQLVPSSKIKLMSPLSPQNIKESAELVTTTTQNFLEQLKQLVQAVSTYLNSFEIKSEAKYETIDDVKSLADNLKVMKGFIDQMYKVFSEKLSQKQDINRIFLHLHNIFLKYNIKISARINRDGTTQNVCHILIILRNTLIMINFLKVLKFDQYYKLQITKIQEKQLNDIAATEVIINRLKGLKMQDYWQRMERKLKNKIQDLVRQSFRKHLEEWEKFQIYKLWKKNFRYFPSFAQKLTKYMKADSSNSNYVMEYFQEINNVEGSIEINSQEIKKINEVLTYNKAILNIDLEKTIVTTQIKAMLEKKQEELIQNATNYKSWENNYVQSAIKEYPQVINKEKQLQKRALTAQSLLDNAFKQLDLKKNQNHGQLISQVLQAKGKMEKQFAERQKKYNDHIKALNQDLLNERNEINSLRSFKIAYENNNNMITRLNQQIINANLQKQSKDNTIRQLNNEKQQLNQQLSTLQASYNDLDQNSKKKCGCICFQFWIKCCPN